MAWLASRGIEPDGGIDAHRREACLSAHVPNDTLVESAEIRIYLYFDRQGRLVKRSIDRFVFSL